MIINCGRGARIDSPLANMPHFGEGQSITLEAGKFFVSYVGCAWCRFGCPGEFGSAEFTDGVWLWPQGLAHYVRHHPIALPADFVRRATSAKSPQSAIRWPPALVQRADDTYWIGWARAYRASALDALLVKGRAAALETCESMLDAAGIQHTTLHGMGAGTCITADCTRQVVGDTVFCGRCLAERDRASLQMDADSLELRKIFRVLPAVLAEQPTQRS